MKKILLLGILFTFTGISVHAGCAIRNSNSCATPDGFMTERKAHCANKTSNCRKTFCEKNCGAESCPIDKKIINMCKAYCTGFVLKNGNEENGLLHAALKQCIGTNGGLERAAAIQQLKSNKQLKSKVEEFIKQLSEEEKHKKLSQKAHEAVIKLREELKATANSITNDSSLIRDLIQIITLQVRLDEGTQDQYNDIYDLEDEEEASRSTFGSRTGFVSPRATYTPYRSLSTTSAERVASRLERRASRSY